MYVYARVCVCVQVFAREQLICRSSPAALPLSKQITLVPRHHHLQQQPWIAVRAWMLAAVAVIDFSDSRSTLSPLLQHLSPLLSLPMHCLACGFVVLCLTPSSLLLLSFPCPLVALSWKTRTSWSCTSTPLMITLFITAFRSPDFHYNTHVDRMSACVRVRACLRVFL